MFTYALNNTEIIDEYKRMRQFTARMFVYKADFFCRFVFAYFSQISHLQTGLYDTVNCSLKLNVEKIVYQR